jgi:membrane fusion protein, multidrug efflux system
MTPEQDIDNINRSERVRPRPPRRRWWILLLLGGLVGIAVYSQSGKAGKAPGASSGADPSRSAERVAVAAVAAEMGELPVYLTGLGSVTPIHTVTVTSRVDGELIAVHYTEGQIVRKGELLAEIDPRPYQAQLTQAQGQLIRDQASLRNAKLDLARYRTLSGQDSISKQQYDTQKSLVRQLEGSVKFDQGQIENAKLQLSYARITAPVSGRIGLRLVDPGNIIRAANTTGLAIITQLEPITVIFTIAEDSLPFVLARLKEGQPLPVDAFNREQREKLATGSLLTVDNQIDPSSGTVRLRAEFANRDHALFPNQFVNARLLLETKRGVTIIPTAAIQRSPQGPFVYAVKPDQTVTVRQVHLGPSAGDHTSIDEGLSNGDLVVVEGTERLREGVPVALTSRTPGNSGDSPQPK